MKQYLFIIIIVIISVITLNIYYNSIKESLNSMIPDNNQITIENSESLRDFLGKMRYICRLDKNSLYDNTKPTVCYKINKLYSYFDSVKHFLDNKTEEEIMTAYGPEEQGEIAGQKVGSKPPTPIVGCNYDYYTLILLSTYMKMLKPYNDLNIWSESNNAEGKRVVQSLCDYNDNTSRQIVNCATKMLTDITNIIDYFQYQINTTDAVAYGDGADTGTGDVPKR